MNHDTWAEVTQDEWEEMKKKEERTWLLLRYLAALIAQEARPVWHEGDGSGGAVIQVLLEELGKAGLSFPDPTTLRWGLDPKCKGQALRREILERDAYRCQVCGDWHQLVIDHIRPRSKGGLTVPENLQTLCNRCNSKKGSR